MAKASSIQGRQELAVSIALAALNVAVSDQPVQPTDRQLERRERREAAKHFEASLAAGKPAADAEPETVKKRPSIHNKRRSSLNPKQLRKVRASSRERQRRWRAKVRAGNVVNGPTIVQDSE